LEELNRHIDLCLASSESFDNHQPTSHTSATDDAVEEYEWAGQTRIRISTLLSESHARLRATVSSNAKVKKKGSPKVVSEDEDITVDIDETKEFGEGQYPFTIVGVRSAQYPN
jgi:hypothetical protein